MLLNASMIDTTIILIVPIVRIQRLLPGAPPQSAFEARDRSQVGGVRGSFDPATDQGKDVASLHYTHGGSRVIDRCSSQHAHYEEDRLQRRYRVPCPYTAQCPSQIASHISSAADMMGSPNI